MEDEEAEHSFSEWDENVDVNAGDYAEEKEKKGTIFVIATALRCRRFPISAFTGIFWWLYLIFFTGIF